MDPFERAWERVAVLGAAVTALASIPTWFTLTLDPALANAAGIPRTSTRGGLVGDGALTLLLALLVVVLIVRARRNDGSTWKTGAFVFLCGFVTALVAAVTYRDATAWRSGIASAEPGAVALSISPALWAVVIGGVLVAVAGARGGIVTWRTTGIDPEAAPADDPDS